MAPGCLLHGCRAQAVCPRFLCSQVCTLSAAVELCRTLGLDAGLCVKGREREECSEPHSDVYVFVCILSILQVNEMKSAQLRGAVIRQGSARSLAGPSPALPERQPPPQAARGPAVQRGDARAARARAPSSARRADGSQRSAGCPLPEVASCPPARPDAARGS